MANETTNTSSGNGPTAALDKSPARDPAQAMAGNAKPADKGADDAQKAMDDAAKARMKAVEAQAKASEAGKSDEQRAADKAAQAADDAHARAVQADRDSRRDSEKAMTVAEAGVVAPHVDPDTPASDPRAVKLGNDPANPKPARGEHMDPDLKTVKLERVSPDMPEPIITYVHPDMVSDYLRAGWSKSEG